MVNFCAVFGCGNRGDRNKDKHFFRLPSVVTHQGEQTLDLTTRRRAEWLRRIRRNDLRPANYPYTRVCSDHFVSGSPSSLYDTGNPDWAPSLKLGYASERVPSADRSERAERRASQKFQREAEVTSSHEGTEETLGVETQTDMSAIEVEEMHQEISALKEELRTSRENSKKEMKLLRDEIARLTTILNEQSTLEIHGFQHNDEKTRFYTGLNTWITFSILLDYLKPHLMQRAALSHFQQVLLTLMRIRLNLQGQDLAYRFRVHPSTVSRTFSHVLEIMYVKLRPLIIWPERDILLKTMPMDFRKYCPKCVVIIDCFEVFLERPTSVLARAQTFSSYKHHNTVKYLIGITPQGSVSYISEGWGGRVSDKHLTENSGLLSNLIPGDTILADRGFDIKESVGLYCATITVPAFTKGKKQLSAIEVEQTRRIANVRIHVERVIGNIRQKYTLLNSTVPIDFVKSVSGANTTLDKIVVVACALINLCESVVPFD